MGLPLNFPFLPSTENKHTRVQRALVKLMNVAPVVYLDTPHAGLKVLPPLVWQSCQPEDVLLYPDQLVGVKPCKPSSRLVEVELLVPCRYPPVRKAHLMSPAAACQGSSF